MPKIKILTDSSSDLTDELIQKYDIGVIPFFINLNGNLFKDGLEISPQDIYDFVTKTGNLPGTAACSIQDYKTVFEKWHNEGYDIICHTISSDMSGSYQNACIAAQGINGIYIVDSRNLSTGVGHVVIRSAKMAAQGLSAPEIVRELDAVIPKVRASFILDNLEYMRKGGRCSSVMLLGSNLLRIKPEIVVEKGTMKVGRKFHGPLEKVLKQYVDAQLENHGSICSDLIFITHTGNPPEMVDTVRNQIALHMHFDDIIETRAGSTVTSHCGPNTLGILFVEKQ